MGEKAVESLLFLADFLRPFAVVDAILSALCLNYLKAISCTLAHARIVFRHIRLVVKATVSRLPGMIYITMVTLACSPLELVPSDELELHNICITSVAPVSQLPLGRLYWLEAPPPPINRASGQEPVFLPPPSLPRTTRPVKTPDTQKALRSFETNV